MVQELRKELDILFGKKIEDPQLDIHGEGRAVVSAVLELLHSSSGSTSFDGYRNGNSYASSRGRT